MQSFFGLSVCICSRVRRYVTPDSKGTAKCSKDVLDMAATSDGSPLPESYSIIYVFKSPIQSPEQS